MIFLTFFAFLGGIVTILSPCILPILPIILSGTVEEGKKRPLGIILGFVLSFTFFTLFLSSLVKATGLSADFLRNISVFILIGFGLSLLIPNFQKFIELLFSRISGVVSKGNKGNGFIGGLFIGLSLGLLWTPCVGPILASIITLAATSTVTLNAIIITLAYSLGTAIPMFLIMYGGRNLLNKVTWLSKNTNKIQKGFGVLMIITALAIYLNFDRKFQAYILEKFPNYGIGLTKLEDNKIVKDELKNLENKEENILDDLKNNFNPIAPELIEGGQWFNSEPLKLLKLRGKVVLIDFWTYTCINCIRTLPYLKSWHEKYKDKGLVIIGIHTPEFEFEKNPENVKKAIDDFELKYPIMQDNDYATWKAYNNRYWPAKYFIDKDGKIRSKHFGEGAYDESEELIQKLLQETGTLSKEMPVNNPEYNILAKTPETYLGTIRKVDNKDLVFQGAWEFESERAKPAKGSNLEYIYEAKDVFLVMGSEKNTSGKIKVFLDNKFLREIEVKEYRLYEIIKLEKFGKYKLRLEFLDDNLELYAFTFG